MGKTDHHVKNSVDFVNKISTLEVPPPHKMVSYDVTALFTSIPVESAIETTRRHMERDQSWTSRTKLLSEDVIELLEICLTTTYFSFQGSFYKQKKGAAMGSPISPIIANIFMEDFEDLALDTAERPPKTWYRYVDDTFTVMHIYDIDDFTEHLNSLDPNIQFTREIEENDQLAFLDTLIHLNNDGTLKTSVYRKQTHTDQYLNFDSHHHLDHKKSVVRTLIHRANSIITEKEDKDKEISHIKQALSANGYKSWILKLPPNKKRQEPEVQTTEKTKTLSIGLPYIRGTSEILQRTFKQYGFTTYHKPFNSIREMLVHPKDKTETLKQSGVIYHITCDTCKETYIGETARPLGTRIEEHKKQNTSAILEHHQKSGHRINWDSVKILDRESSMLKRKVKEALHIKRHRPALNRDTGLYLPPIYDHLLSRDCHSHVMTHEPLSSRSDC